MEIYIHIYICVYIYEVYTYIYMYILCIYTCTYSHTYISFTNAIFKAARQFVCFSSCVCGCTHMQTFPKDYPPKSMPWIIPLHYKHCMHRIFSNLTNSISMWTPCACSVENLREYFFDICYFHIFYFYLRHPHMSTTLDTALQSIFHPAS